VTRPRGFYDDWSTFCEEALGGLIKGRQEGMEVVLLTAAAVLGGSGLTALLLANRETLDAKGREWGVPNLTTLMSVGSVVLGAGVMAMVTRALSRRADTAKVDALQERLAAARREFEALRNDRKKGGVDAKRHEAAVEKLFAGLVRPSR
jgi:hypothetical protein